MTKNISDLKVGDVVVIGNRRQPMTTETVTRLTATQIVTDSGKRFSKRTGDVIGGSSFHVQHYLRRNINSMGGSGLMSVEEMHRENEQEANRQEILRYTALIQNNSNKLRAMSLDDLKTIADLMGLSK